MSTIKPFERLKAVHNLQKLYGVEDDDHSFVKTMKLTGMTRSELQSLLLYDKLAEPVREKALTNVIKPSIALELTRLGDKEQVKAAEIVEKHDLSAMQTRSLSHMHHKQELTAHELTPHEIENEMLFWSRLGWLLLLIGLTVCFILVVFHE